MTVSKLLRYYGKPPRPRTYWKATLRSAPPLAFVLLGEWHQQIKIFRWKWLASAVARWHKLTSGRRALTEAIVEPYRVGANVISFGVSEPTAGKKA